MLPVNAQMLDQETRCHHAHPVVHPAGLPKFAHPGIDDWKTGLPPLPGLKCGLILIPGKIFELRTKGLLGEMRPVKQQVIGKLPPYQLAQKRPPATFISAVASGCQPLLDGLPAAMGADFPEMQMRRQPGCAFDIRPVASIVIACHGFIQKPLQPLFRPGFPRHPGRMQTASPVGACRPQPPIIEPLARGPALR